MASNVFYENSFLSFLSRFNSQDENLNENLEFTNNSKLVFSCRISDLLTSQPQSISGLCNRTSECCLRFGFDGGCLVSNPDLIQNFKYAVSRLSDLKTNLVGRCCSRDTECQNRFENIKLINDIEEKMSDSEEPPKLGGYYKTSGYGGEIHINQTGLNCNSHGCIDRLLLHELGHGCQNANQIEFGHLNKDIVTPIIGKETTKCFFDAIDKQHLYSKTPHNLQSWYDEAFADLIFYGDELTIERIAFSCHTIEDSKHALPKAYLHCVVPLNNLKQFKSL